MFKLSFISFFLMVLMLIYDRSPLKFLTVGSLPVLLGMSIAYDIRNWEAIQFWFEYANISQWFSYLLLYFITSMGLLISVVLISPLFTQKTPTNVADNDREYYRRLKIFTVLLLGISILAFIFALLPILESPATAWDSMKNDPRAWEYAFGRSRFLNYLYFSKVAAACIAMYLWAHKKLSFHFAVTVYCLVVAMSLFHGIKFTIVDAAVLPLAVAFAANIIYARRLIFGGAIFACLLLVIYFSYVRGATTSVSMGILGYWVSNFHNLAYVLQEHPFQFGGISELVVSPRLLNPLEDMTFKPFFGFALNPLYNMSTGFHTIFANLSYIGPLIFFPMLSFFMAISFRRAAKSLIASMCFAFLAYNFGFLFFYYGFTKEKLVFICFLVIATHIASRIRYRVIRNG